MIKIERNCTTINEESFEICDFISYEMLALAFEEKEKTQPKTGREINVEDLFKKNILIYLDDIEEV